MKLNYLIIILSLIIFTNHSKAQTSYSEIDKTWKKIPNNITKHKEIAHYLTRNINTEKEKIRAIYIWITHNIKYDYTKKNKNSTYPLSHNFSEEVLQKRKGVCLHYSSLFKTMAEDVGIKAYIINGISKNYKDSISALSHSWNAVKIDNSYFFLDLTWASGFVINNIYVNEFRDIYFLSKADEFIKDHLPYDPIWQFKNHTINIYDFKKNVLDSEARYFNFKDSLIKYEKQSSLNKLIFSTKRIISSGTNNANFKNKIKHNKTRINNIKYNKYIDSLNYGIKKYNNYIRIKNTQFNNCKIADNSILYLINNAKTGIYNAYKGLNALKTENIHLKKLIIKTKETIPALKNNLDKEIEFVDIYINTEKKYRKKLFYIKQD